MIRLTPSPIVGIPLYSSLHNFHIPVMGTGHSVDTPLRVAPFGIDSVVSIVDDLLLEQIRAHYCKELELEYEPIKRRAEDGRAKRITAYFDLMHYEVQRRFEAIQAQTLGTQSDKDKYFRLLPESSTLKTKYNDFLKLEDSSAKESLEAELTQAMRPGSIDANIMVKLDRTTYDTKGNEMGPEHSDARSALRGFANSKVSGSIVYSAGINQGLYTYMEGFPDFYRGENGLPKKRIVIKVSDFRSAMIQGKFLARKGLEVWEFRVESGLNCGGHAFASQGLLLPVLLQEFNEKRTDLQKSFLPLVQRHYKKQRHDFPEAALNHQPRLSVQGGLGNSGENFRMWDDIGVDSVGWASPFLLVPEATPIDQPTREQLRAGQPEDFYLSDASPLGVPFNNLRNSGSDIWTREEAQTGKSGSGCPKGFLVSNTEFSEQPICTASKLFQRQKFEQIGKTSLDSGTDVDDILAKQCICDHLGNGALIDLGERKLEKSPQSICPGPNLAWFNDFYSLEQMVDHIYGRSESLVPQQRPHMYAAEIKLYLDYYKKEKARTPENTAYWEVFYDNLISGLAFCATVGEGEAVRDENLASLAAAIAPAKAQLA